MSKALFLSSNKIKTQNIEDKNAPLITLTYEKPIKQNNENFLTFKNKNKLIEITPKYKLKLKELPLSPKIKSRNINEKETNDFFSSTQTAFFKQGMNNPIKTKKIFPKIKIIKSSTNISNMKKRVPHHSHFLSECNLTSPSTKPSMNNIASITSLNNLVNINNTINLTNQIDQINQNNIVNQNNDTPLINQKDNSKSESQMNSTTKTNIEKEDLIKLVNLRNEKINQMKKEKYLLNIEKKNKQLEANKEIINKQKNDKLYKNEKIEEMRKLKLKIFNILTKEGHIICDDFHRKASNFNIKLLELLGGQFCLNQAIKSDENFHFNNEIHDKRKMIIDLDKMVELNNYAGEKLKNELTKEEKLLISTDPKYFSKNIHTNNDNLDFIRGMSLAKRLQKEDILEEEEKIKEPKRIDQKTIEENLAKLNGNKKNVSAGCSDIYMKIKEIDNSVNKTRYNNKTKILNYKKLKLTPYEFYDKTIQDLNMKLVGFGEHDNAKTERQNIKRRRNHNIKYENIVNSFKYKKEYYESKVQTLKSNQNCKKFDFNYEVFNDEEKEFILKINKEILRLNHKK